MKGAGPHINTTARPASLLRALWLSRGHFELGSCSTMKGARTDVARRMHRTARAGPGCVRELWDAHFITTSRALWIIASGGGGGNWADFAAAGLAMSAACEETNDSCIPLSTWLLLLLLQ